MSTQSMHSKMKTITHVRDEQAVDAASTMDRGQALPRPTAVAAAAALLTTLAMQTAWAQSAPAAPAAPASAASAPSSEKSSSEASTDKGNGKSELDKVVITGTGIRGIAPTGASVSMVSREAIAATGATTSTELLRSLPEVGSFNATGNNTGNNQANFVDQPAIHGVGVGNGGGGLTLVLLDGHRLPGAGINQTAPDAGAIPPSALERVEVMADGGSSIYGSDAIAGVINFVTRRSLNGAETAVRAGFADGYKTTNFSQLLGKTWDGGNALVALEYSSNTALNGTRRDYITNDQRRFGGGDSRSSTCSPANVTVGGQTFALSATGAPAVGLNLCDSNRANDLYPDQHRSQAFFKARQELGDRFSVYGSLLYSARDVGLHVSGSGITSGATTLSIDGTSPYYRQMPGTAAGAAQTVTYDPSADFGSTFTNNITTRTLSAVAGLDIDLSAGWNGKVELNRGLERDDVRNHGIDAGAMQSAVTNGTFNPYGLGAANNAAVLDRLGSYETRYYGRQTLDSVTAKADGPLFRLDAGTVRAAVGVEHRSEKFYGMTTSGAIGSATTPVSTLGKRTSNSAFAEVFVPLIGEKSDITGIRKLELSIAARRDDYSDVGATTNPKIGLNWRVVDGATIRASAGRSFHAPSLADAGTAIDTRAIRFGCVPGAFIGCDAAGATDYTVILAGGNSGLKPEKASTYNLGFDLSPALIPGVKASLSYFVIDYKNVITFPTFAPATNPMAAYNKYRVTRPAGISDTEWLAIIQPMLAGFRHDGAVYPDVNNLPTAIYDLRRQNFSDQDIRGLDFSIEKRFNLESGDITAGLTGTRLLKFEQKIPGVAEPLKILDTAYAIKTKLRAQLGWSTDDLAASLFYNYTAGYYNQNTTPTQRVSSFSTVDGNVAWTLPTQALLGRVQLSLTVNNLFDKRPPVVFTAGNNGVIAYDPTVSSALGRMISIGLHKTW